MLLFSVSPIIYKIFVLLVFSLSFKFLTLSILLLTTVSLLFFTDPAPAPAQVSPEFSLLWGQAGELWNPKGRLPDFSFAGYHQGEDPLPTVPVKASVKNFGAKGNGVTDDSQAFLKAISAVSNGALFIPAGRYVITKVLELKKSNLVLRGEGPDKTVLYFPKPLEEILGRNYNNGQSGYSFGNAFLRVPPGSGTIKELGIEELTIEFPKTTYGSHWSAKGYNAIEFRSQVVNSWIRNVTIVNFDIGINFNGTKSSTVTGIRLTGRGGHHGLRVTNAADNLFTDFAIENTSIHDITVQDEASGNVFSNGTGVDICFDHHGDNPHDNLFSNIDVGKGSRLWVSGGNPKANPASGLRETFWNIRNQNGVPPSKAPGFANPGQKGPLAPQVNLIGATFTKMTPNNEWVEGINPVNLFPQDLHLAQLASRLNRLVTDLAPATNTSSNRSSNAE